MPKIHEELLLGKSLLLKFVKAHLEDPAQLKPRDYWYGQEYSYLTRDLIDLARKIVDEVNSIIKKLLNDQTDEVTRLGLLAARVKIIRAKIESLYERKVEIKKPLVPQTEEIDNNPRSRSAKLRYAIRNNNTFFFPTEFKKKFEHYFKIEEILS